MYHFSKTCFLVYKPNASPQKKFQGIFEGYGNANSDSTAALPSCNKTKYKPLFLIFPLKAHFHFLDQEGVVLAVPNVSNLIY